MARWRTVESDCNTSDNKISPELCVVGGTLTEARFPQSRRHHPSSHRQYQIVSYIQYWLLPHPQFAAIGKATLQALNPMKVPRTYTKVDVERAFARPCSIHDRPAYIYMHCVEHPDGSLVIKVGRAKDVDRRLEQWQNQCYMDDIQLIWEIPCEHATKLERLVHLEFKSENAWLATSQCESCGVRHQEKFDVQKVGGVEEAK
ncbi:meiotically up-regulated gene 113-domain-containing protein [Mycena sp. CBHHK59/15]|nr:meiotically up-regulated gene 113-domain-containing protein [Mycena sp. CBHHK59/15]